MTEGAQLQRRASCSVRAAAAPSERRVQLERVEGVEERSKRSKVLPGVVRHQHGVTMVPPRCHLL